MNQILIHTGNNNCKLPHIRKLKIEKAVNGNILMRLPCRALIDGGALGCQYITNFMSNGKFIDVFSVSRLRRHHLSSSIAPSLSPSPIAPLPYPTTTSSSIRTTAVIIAVAVASIVAIAIAVAAAVAVAVAVAVAIAIAVAVVVALAVCTLREG